MARSTGLGYRRGYQIDAESIVVGAVQAGTKGRAAATRTGAAMLLNTSVNNMSEFRAVLAGQTSNSAGGYLLQFAHVPLNKGIGDASGWVTSGILSVSGQTISEVVLSGKQVYDAVYARATAGFAVSASARTTDQVTLTVLAGHGFLAGDAIFLSGFAGDGATFNGAWTVGSVTATTIVFTHSGSGTIATGGTGTAYSGTARTLATDEMRIFAVRALAGTGSNGAASPAGTNTLFLDPLASDA
jgi:hypothetical protein